MKSKIIGKRYANALFEIDKENNSYDKTYSDLITISDIISNYKAKMRKLRLYSLELEEKGDMQQ